MSFDFIDTEHSQTKSLFKCSFFFHLITSCCRFATFFKINSKTSQVDQNQGLFPVYLCFLQKSRTFQGLKFLFSYSKTFPVLRTPGNHGVNVSCMHGMFKHIYGFGDNSSTNFTFCLPDYIKSVGHDFSSFITYVTALAIMPLVTKETET